MTNFQVVVPLAGTTHWGPNGQALGVWGRDLQVRPMALLADGTIRPLTKREIRKFLKKANGGVK